MDEPRYDEGEWPLLRITMPERELGEVELLAHLDKLSQFCERERPFVQVIDVRGARALSARARRVVAERLDQDDDRYPGMLLGVAVVLATPLHRGIFKAISWLSRSTRPFEAFLAVDDARAWAWNLVRSSSMAPRSVRASLAPVDSEADFLG